MATPDRIEELKENALVTGIDFIYVYSDQLKIDVNFYTFNEHPPAPPPVKIKQLLNDLLPDDIRIYNAEAAAPDIPVESVNWTGDNILQLQVNQTAGFVRYKIRINDRKDPAVDPFRIDPYYNDVAFSFKANCPADLDCKTPEQECAVNEMVDFPIDYSARDFWSYRRALLEFASLRYPNWPDRLAADAAVMLTEVMSAVGDEMAYYQDRISREAYLETATQRRSLRRHARLVDYYLHDGSGAFAWIDVTVKPFLSGAIAAGTNVWASGENGVRTDFEIGNGLAGSLNNIKVTYTVAAASNQFKAYQWDEDQVCLPVGTTEVYIEGHHSAHLQTFEGSMPKPGNGKWVLLKTMPSNPAQPARSMIVELVWVEDRLDPVFNQPVTFLKWQDEQCLPYEMDLTVLYVRGNMVPATAGLTCRQYFITGAGTGELLPAAKAQLEAMANADGATIMQSIEREGINGAVTHLCTLANSEEAYLVWLGSDPEKAVPEIKVEELEFNGLSWVEKKTWKWQRSLVGIYSSATEDRDYTLDDGSWRRVVGYWRNGQEIVHNDYASGSGTTIRFGNGDFGLIPAEKSVFKASYRLGSGSAGNVAPGAINSFDSAALNFVAAVANPLNAINGKNAEAFNHARQSAPELFRTVTCRAVKPEDYAEAAKRLEWVQNAGASFRWTGSWLTAFVTPDPRHAVVLTEEWRKDLFNQLNRFRQAGREVASLEPVYADIDLEIEVCASPFTYPGELKKRIMIKLFGQKGGVPVKGFFSPDRFTFGDPLQRSQLEAAIQEEEGVNAVESIRFRRRGFFDWKQFTGFTYDPGKDAIIRVENDLQHPERGILKLYIHGGA